MTNKQPGLNLQQAEEFYNAIKYANDYLNFAANLCLECGEMVMFRIVQGLANTVKAVHNVDIRPEQDQ